MKTAFHSSNDEMKKITKILAATAILASLTLVGCVTNGGGNCCGKGGSCCTSCTAGQCQGCDTGCADCAPKGK